MTPESVPEVESGLDPESMFSPVTFKVKPEEFHPDEEPILEKPQKKSSEPKSSPSDEDDEPSFVVNISVAPIGFKEPEDLEDSEEKPKSESNKRPKKDRKPIEEDDNEEVVMPEKVPEVENVPDDLFPGEFDDPLDSTGSKPKDEGVEPISIPDMESPEDEDEDSEEVDDTDGTKKKRKRKKKKKGKKPLEPSDVVNEDDEMIVPESVDGVEASPLTFQEIPEDEEITSSIVEQQPQQPSVPLRRRPKLGDMPYDEKRRSFDTKRSSLPLQEMVQQLGSKQGLKGIWPTLFAGSKPEDKVDYEPYNSFLNFVEKEASNPKKVSAKLNPLTKHKKYLEVSEK